MVRSSITVIEWQRQFLKCWDQYKQVKIYRKFYIQSVTWLDNCEPSCSLDVACCIWTYTLEDASIYFHESKDSQVVSIHYLQVVILHYNIPILYPVHMRFWFPIYSTLKLYILLLQCKAVRRALQKSWRNCKILEHSIIHKFNLMLRKKLMHNST